MLPGPRFISLATFTMTTGDTVDPRKWMTTLETKTKRGGGVERGKIQSNLDNSNLEGGVQIFELRKFRPIELFMQRSFTKQIGGL